MLYNIFFFFFKKNTFNIHNPRFSVINSPNAPLDSSLSLNIILFSPKNGRASHFIIFKLE